MKRIIAADSGFEGMGYNEYRIILGINVTMLSERIGQSSSSIFSYLRGADIVDFIRAQERVVRYGRNKLMKLLDYVHYGNMFLGRATPTLLEIDGVRRLVQGEPKGGLLELTAGLYKNLWDLYSISRRKIIIEALNDSRIWFHEIKRGEERCSQGKA